MRELIGTSAALLALSLAIVAGPFAQAAPDPGPDANFFEATVVVKGFAEVDYGEDRFTAKSNTSGVDGKAQVKWRWEVRAAAFSEGGGRLVTRAIAGRGRAKETGTVVSWGKGMVQLGETRLCEELGENVKYTHTSDGRRLPPQELTRGEFVPDGQLSLRGGAVHAESPFSLPSLCFHGSLTEHDLVNPDVVSGRQAPVPRGAFNPLFDRSFERDYPPSRVSHDRSLPGDPNSAHVYTAENRVSVEVDAISRRRFDKLVRKYQHLPAVDGEQVSQSILPPA